MSRRTRTFLPTTASLLRPTVNHSSVDSLQLKRQKATFYHVRHILEFPELEIGPKVRVAPLRKNQTWKQGTCTEKLSDRSYVVQLGGMKLRRNRKFLKPAREPSVQVKPDSNLDNDVHREPVRCCSWGDKGFSTLYPDKDPQHSSASKIQGFWRGTLSLLELWTFVFFPGS